MNKPEQEFIDHLRLVRHYSEKTALSYQEDIDIFCDFIFKEGVLMEDVDTLVIRNFLTEELYITNVKLILFFAWVFLLIILYRNWQNPE